MQPRSLKAIDKAIREANNKHNQELSDQAGSPRKVTDQLQAKHAKEIAKLNKEKQESIQITNSNRFKQKGFTASTLRDSLREMIENVNANTIDSDEFKKIDKAMKALSSLDTTHLAVALGDRSKAASFTSSIKEVRAELQKEYVRLAAAMQQAEYLPGNEETIEISYKSYLGKIFHPHNEAKSDYLKGLGEEIYRATSSTYRLVNGKNETDRGIKYTNDQLEKIWDKYQESMMQEYKKNNPAENLEEQIQELREGLKGGEIPSKETMKKLGQALTALGRLDTPHLVELHIEMHPKEKVDRNMLKAFRREVEKDFIKLEGEITKVEAKLKKAEEIAAEKAHRERTPNIDEAKLIYDKVVALADKQFHPHKGDISILLNSVKKEVLAEIGIELSNDSLKKRWDGIQDKQVDAFHKACEKKPHLVGLHTHIKDLKDKVGGDNPPTAKQMSEAKDMIDALKKLDTAHLVQIQQDISSGQKISKTELKQFRRDLEKDFKGLEKAAANRLQRELTDAAKSFDTKCLQLAGKATDSQDSKKIQDYRIKIEKSVNEAKQSCKDKEPGEQVKILQSALKSVTKEGSYVQKKLDEFAKIKVTFKHVDKSMDETTKPKFK